MLSYISAILAQGIVFFITGIQPITGTVSGNEADKERLQGRWRVVSVEFEDEKEGDESENRLIISGDKLTVSWKGISKLIEGTFRLDPSKKPNTIDVTITYWERKGVRGKTMLGIYEVDGNTLKWCTGKPGSGVRPAGFSATKGTMQIFIVLKREETGTDP